MLLSPVILVTLLSFSAGYDDVSIVQWLKNDGNFNTLVAAVQAAGLEDTLENQGPFTVFAPTDLAFNKLGQATIDSLISTPAQLAVILSHHVVTSYIFSDSIIGAATVTPLDGQDLTVVRNGQNLEINNVSTISTTIRDQVVNNGGAGGMRGRNLVINNVSTISTAIRDQVVNNGIIHAIDTVLLPPGSSTSTPPLNIMQYLLTDSSRFLDVTLALLLANITSVLDGGDFTFFAPVDAAFAKYENNLLDPSQPNIKLVYAEVMKYHMVPGSRTANQLSNGQSLYTLHGVPSLPLNITINSSGVLINNRARVIDADILCSNGVIHAVDDIMIPSDINQVIQG